MAHYIKLIFLTAAVVLSGTVMAIEPESFPTNTPTEFSAVAEGYDYDLDISNEELDRLDKYLIIVLDMYGRQAYSKVVIVDVDLETSVLVAKDLFRRIDQGIYTVIGSSADNLVSQKLIIR